MEILKELSYISTYRPQKGDLLKLFQLLVEEGKDRSEIAAEFGKATYFRMLYKQLKDHLLDGILNFSFSKLGKEQQFIIKIQKRSLECHILFQTGKSKAGVKIAKETLLQAEKHDLLHAALGLSTILELHYSSIQADKLKRNKYQNKSNELFEAYQQEVLARRIFGNLSFSLRKSQLTKDLIESITDLEKIAVSNKRYRFNIFYFATKNLYYRIAKEETEIIKNLQEAIAFFESLQVKKSYISEWNFRYQLVPIHMKRREYKKAEFHLNECLKLPTTGEYNWHLTLLLKAVLGFYCNNLLMVKEARNTAVQIPKKFDSKGIEDYWQVLRAYLFLFAKWGKIELEGNFRLYRFLNSVKVSNIGKPNLLILELLHVLAKGNKTEYRRLCEKITPYISKKIRKKNKRTKCFLRMLKAVESGNYHPVRVAKHAKKYKDQLYLCEHVFTINILEIEPVPYELLWEELIEWLDRRRLQ